MAVHYGVHKYIDQLQTKLNQIGQANFDRFFAFKFHYTSTSELIVNLSSNL